MLLFTLCVKNINACFQAAVGCIHLKTDDRLLNFYRNKNVCINLACALPSKYSESPDKVPQALTSEPLFVLSSVHSSGLISRKPLGIILQPISCCQGSYWRIVRPAAGNLVLQFLPAVTLPHLLWQPLQLPAVPGNIHEPLSCFSIKLIQIVNGRYFTVFDICWGNIWSWNRILLGELSGEIAISKHCNIVLFPQTWPVTLAKLLWVSL